MITKVRFWLSDTGGPLDYEALLDSVDGIVWEADPETMRFRYVSRQAERLLGYPVELWLKEDHFWEDHIHPEDRVWVPDFCRSECQAGRPHQFEYRMIAADGRVVWLRDLCGVRFENDRMTSLYGVMVDVSDRVRAEEDRRAFDAQLQHTQKLESLGLLAEGLAHHFNNLLMSVLGNADMVLSELSPDSPAVSRIERIKRSAKSGSELTHHLLSYAGVGEIDPRHLDLSALVRDAEDLLRIAVTKNARLDLELDEDLPAVEADSSQLAQVLLGLTTNASEALGEEAGIVTLRTGVFDAANGAAGLSFDGAGPTHGRFVYLEVSDTGVGMDEATRLQVFDPFYTTKFVGRGLGLASVLGIVRHHHGFVSLDSTPGRGTHVRVLLPTVAEQSASKDDRQLGAREPRAEGLILVVDDEDDVRETAGEMLEQLGYEVHLLSRGIEALEWVRNHAGAISTVLMDFTMPEMTGAEVAQELHRIRPDVPILFMSGLQESHVRSRLHEAVDFGFVKKPFDREELARALRDRISRGDTR